MRSTLPTRFLPSFAPSCFPLSLLLFLLLFSCSTQIQKHTLEDIDNTYFYPQVCTPEFRPIAPGSTTLSPCETPFPTRNSLQLALANLFAAHKACNLGLAFSHLFLFFFFSFLSALSLSLALSLPLCFFALFLFLLYWERFGLDVFALPSV